MVLYLESLSAVLFAFAALILPPVYIFFTRLLLEAQDSRCSVISLVSARVQRAGQYELVGRRRLAFRRSIAAVNSKQNGYMTALTANSEIPPRVDLGPMGKIHKSCPLRKWRRFITKGQAVLGSNRLEDHNRMKVVSLFN
jgi:hypothetical protein